MVVGLWHWIEQNAAGLSLLVPFLAIGGGLLGNWLGARIQAAGGLAQASAAREAARITAEASRLAALRDERRLAIAEFVRAARTLFRISWDLYHQDHEEEASRAHAALSYAYAEVELCAPTSIVLLAASVLEAAEDAWFLARSRGPAARIVRLLRVPAADGGTPGLLAYDTVRAARIAAANDRPDRDAIQVQALRELRRCGLLDERQVMAVYMDIPHGYLVTAQQERGDAYAAALHAFVNAARQALGANREGGVEWIPASGGTRPVQN
ncbi:hypothetical protein ACIQU4_39450 [Streptomyces sp. NPDC090741]|uniref:hypothetical protein n=1 Tax=Streptomyces sp. NPDC090741 TaxID=3365967 RepID=UPI0037FCD13B